VPKALGWGVASCIGARSGWVAAVAFCRDRFSAKKGSQADEQKLVNWIGVPPLEVSMRAAWCKAVMVAVLLGVASYAFGAGESEQTTKDMNSMTVPELVKAGDASRASKDYLQAIDYFKEALRKDKKNAEIYNKLGLAELARGNTDSARYAFERAVKLNSKYADALNNVGAVYFKEKNYNGATKYFKKAVALDETRATFHVNLGAAWFSQKKVDKAMKEYGRALELDPDVLNRTARVGITAQIASPEERAKFYYELAKIQAKRGDVDACLHCLMKAKENGYRELANVYKDEQFTRVWSDPRLQEVVPAPTPK
jgi:tetratricopeptide (TPR) repeat protein